ncbi:MAG: cupin [Paenibacillus sp.]|nr:cupin [Paenibacillus sp.]
MKINNFSKEYGKSIEAFNSKNLIMTRILSETDSVHIGCKTLEADGIIGLHQASISQLFLVVNGEGWVKGKEVQS